MPRENLKAARNEKGMTQQQVADQLGITLRYYQAIEAEERTGDFQLWDELEDLFSIHQRILRQSNRTSSQGKLGAFSQSPVAKNTEGTYPPLHSSGKSEAQ